MNERTNERMNLEASPTCRARALRFTEASPRHLRGNADRQVVDRLNVTAGIRSVDFDASAGLSLNGQPLKIRGFCDHSNMGGVGGAVPDRLNLYRAQALRAVGANAWRMAHNPPIPARLDVMDRLGMLAMDENRDFGGHKGQGGVTDETVAQELQDMTDMVRRDRSHPRWARCWDSILRPMRSDGTPPPAPAVRRHAIP